MSPEELSTERLVYWVYFETDPFLNRLHATQPCIRKRSIHLAQVVIQNTVFRMGVTPQATLIFGVQVGTVLLAVYGCHHNTHVKNNVYSFSISLQTPSVLKALFCSGMDLMYCILFRNERAKFMLQTLCISFMNSGSFQFLYLSLWSVLKL